MGRGGIKVPSFSITASAMKVHICISKGSSGGGASRISSVFCCDVEEQRRRQQRKHLRPPPSLIHFLLVSAAAPPAGLNEQLACTTQTHSPATCTLVHS